MDISQILRALTYASIKHRDQRRKDAEASPYINHPIAVAAVLAAEGAVTSEEILIAAILHDTVEDTQTTYITMSSLSGGNQQKALLGKWLTLPKLRVLILHEPTQGVDVASRKMLFEYVHQAAEQGIAVLYVSAEYEDLAHLCDRVIVMRSGRIDTELVGADVSLARIVEQCYGVEAQAH